jgi:hypothetical protein
LALVVLGNKVRAMMAQTLYLVPSLQRVAAAVATALAAQAQALRVMVEPVARAAVRVAATLPEELEQVVRDLKVETRRAILRAAAVAAALVQPPQIPETAIQTERMAALAHQPLFPAHRLPMRAAAAGRHTTMAAAQTDQVDRAGAGQQERPRLRERQTLVVAVVDVEAQEQQVRQVDRAW